MGALNWASMFHRAWTHRVLLSLGRAGRAHMDLIYPWTGVLGRGLGHYVREPPGQEYWGLDQHSLGSCWLPAVPHQPCFPAPSLTQLEWGSERKAGPPLWALG